MPEEPESVLLYPFGLGSKDKKSAFHAEVKKKMPSIEGHLSLKQATEQMVFTAQ